MSNKNRTTLYIDVTNDIKRSVYEHKEGIRNGFTSRNNLIDLLYVEEIRGIQNAINKEKQLKRWRKERKWNLIKENNPRLEDLSKYW